MSTKVFGAIGCVNASIVSALSGYTHFGLHKIKRVRTIKGVKAPERGKDDSARQTSVSNMIKSPTGPVA